MSKLAILFTLILKIVGLFKVLAIKTIKIDNNKVVSGSKTDKTIDKLAKSKNINNCLKSKNL